MGGLLYRPNATLNAFTHGQQRTQTLNRKDGKQILKLKLKLLLPLGSNYLYGYKQGPLAHKDADPLAVGILPTVLGQTHEEKT